MRSSTLTIPSSDVVRHVLSNGMTVLVRPDFSAPVAAVVTYVKAGYFDETDDVVGIAHVLEHMFFKGTPTRGVGEIAKQTKASGGYLNAATIYDHTRYYVVLPASGFDAGLAIQADAYANSLIDPDELRRELEVIIQEANRKADSPEAVTTETLFELLHDRHRIRRWRIGREAGLRALTRDQLVGFYRNFYRPASTILTIVGAVDPDLALRRAEELYGGMPDVAPDRTPGPTETAPSGRRYRELEGDVTHVHAAFGWRTPGAADRDTAYLDLAATILSSGRASRLYRAVREQRFVTSIAAWNYTPHELGVFVVQLEGEPERTVDALSETWRQLARLGDGVSATELTRAQRLFESRMLRRLETMEGQANHLADWEALGDWQMGEAHARTILEATPADVAGAVARHLDLSQVALLLYQPRGRPALGADATAAFAVLEGGDSARTMLHDPGATARNSAPAVLSGMTPERIVNDVHVFRTGGGVPILVRQRRAAPIAHFAVYAAGGAAREPAGSEGLGTLLTRAALKGTASRDAATIALESELLGGGISASTSSDGLGWGFSVPTRAFAEAVDLLADVTLHPALGDDIVDTERVIARAQLAQFRDDMYRYPTRLATEAAYEGHPYARSPMGTDEGLAGLTPGDLRAWHEQQVLAADVVLAVVADVDPAEAAREMAAAFAALRHRPGPALTFPVWKGKATQRVELRDKAQTALTLAYPGPARGDVARHAAHLLAIIASGLGGRFFDELRERQSLAYTVHVSPTARVASGMMSAYIATAPEKEEAARDGLLREFGRLREEPVTSEELQRAQTYALGSHAIAQQNAGHALGEMMDAWMYGGGLEELSDFETRIRAITAMDILELARRYYDPAQRVEGIVRGKQRAERGERGA
ncbi:MAG: M16 family metallopeptidase [Gemmatimonadaceae bacterium]